ncbi:uncharacterized protein LOC118274590 isoform X13 [Spodoptera frugiperda]|uniref:Uncharacterized protein LOC118274590 isoform X13 n=1 Tax=Spodoptera frugiperda TaxID=7108 RepID=A0A9R0DCB2_SPOFR|nr:uncharacterized protein LOC118274590 isoform X13 [Spodoptera frugiperda]
MKLSVSAYRAHASAHKKILTSSYQQHYGSTAAPPICNPLQPPNFTPQAEEGTNRTSEGEDNDGSEINAGSSRVLSAATSREEDDDSSNNASSESKSPGQRRPIIASSSSSSRKSMQDTERAESDTDKRGHKWRHVQAVMAYYQALRKIKRTKSNQRWMKLRTTVQLSSAIQKKPPLKREDSFLKRFSTRQTPLTQETVEDTGSEGATGDHRSTNRQRRRKIRAPRTVVNPDENFFFYWLWLITIFVLYNLWTLIVRQSFPELQIMCHHFWLTCDGISDVVFALDLVVQFRTGYLEQGLMVYDSKKLAKHYIKSRNFLLDIVSLAPLDLLQLHIGTNPIIRFPRFCKVYRAVDFYYIVESRTVYPNFWRVINLIHILLILAHWFGCFYFLLSEAEGFQGDWVYPHRPGDYATLTRKYLGSLYWSTLTLTTIGDLPTPETNAEYVFTIVSYLIGVFIFATIVGQVGNVITNRNANRLEFERLLDGAKTYMRHHKVPGGMKRRVLRWYDYSWSRGRIQGGGDINTALGLLPDKLKTELALHVNLSVLKKVTIFQECQPEFLHDLVLKMKAYIFTPGDSICRKGEVAREMFIIADGILEVISEQGRVLTTMKAGDFFGEIGILNLDGLNKRTADVRSVGYSELFSLSREDVLAAMKDYPEAQEILQTLGRKRLQEAKNMSKKCKGEISPDKMSGDDSTSKRIVHKLRSDVKGIRNAIRSRSRAGRRSGESLELQALAGAERAGTAEGKVLRRMPRVESDDSAHPHNQDDNNGETTSGSKDGEKCISPIGAGLPLLSRLKLLKEKQDREEKVAKQRHSTSSVLSLTPQPTPSTSSAPDAEPEVIGAGLPLIQRLLLLKAKEERDKNQLTPTMSNQPSSSDTISPTSIKSPLSPTIKTLSPIRKGSESSSPGKLQSPTTKTSRKNSSGSSDGTSRPKVSFRDKILQVQSDGTAVCQPLNKDTSEKPAAVVEPTPKTESNLISIPHSVVSKIKSPAKAVGTTFRDKLKLLQSGPKDTDNATVEKAKSASLEKAPVEISPLPTTEAKEEPKNKKPWTKLKKAAILGESKSQSKSSLDEKKDESINTSSEKKDEGIAEAVVNICVPIVTTAELVKIDNNNVEVASDNDKDKPKLCLTGPLEPVQEKSLDLLTLSPKKNVNNVTKPAETKTHMSPGMLLPKVKKYRSIDDLSPEYGGLPFVKKLKILNERQKLAELEKVVKIRSSSLDCTSSSEDLLCDTLTRSHSEGSTMDKRKFKRKSIDSCRSHESNETLERRELKSILKKLSEDVTPAESPERSNELKRLIRAPTLEGYAARHSKFAKSVTFHRHTLPSPPGSAPADYQNDDVFTMPEVNISSMPQISPPPPPDVEVTVPETPNNQIARSAEPNVPTDYGLNIRAEYELQQNIDPMIDLKSLRPEEIKVPSEKPKLTLISAVANQRKLLRGSIEEQEYFGEVLLGIKQVIQGHLHDVQGKFQERFNSLENEVRKRDEIISQLQKRIQELEKLGLSGMSPTAQPTGEVPSMPEVTEAVQPTSTSQPISKSASSGSEDASAAEEGFMRGDSLDTVFATSPPTASADEAERDRSPENETAAAKETLSPDDLTEENLRELTEGIELSKLSYAELQNLAVSLSRADKTSSSKEQWTISKSKRLDLNLDGKAGTYSRKRAAKLKQRKSWEDQSDQESMEMQDLTRPLSPHTTSEDRSLLSPEQSSLRSSRRHFHFFGSHLDNTKSKIKKTLSVDTGMHHTGKNERKGRPRQHRKFSLGSLFHRTPTQKPTNNCNDVVLDMGSDYSWSDAGSTSSSSDSESLPRTPMFEEFVENSSRRGRASSSSHGSSSPIRALPGSGGDWEVMMLADELEKREREKEREDARRHLYPTTLRDLEEESDTPQRDDSPDEYSNIEDSNSSSTTHLLSQSISDASQRSLETSFTEQTSRIGREPRQRRVGSVGEPVQPDSSFRQSRGLILRAASLDRETTPTTSAGARRFGSLKSASTDSHKRL